MDACVLSFMYRSVFVSVVVLEAKGREGKSATYTTAAERAVDLSIALTCGLSGSGEKLCG